jgi:D-sedoheptulose 7-phosphate isomerase
VYSRMIEGCGRKGDVLVGISTSGNSKNVIEALKKANEKEMITVSMTGETGGKMKELSKYILNVPSTDTPRIQESHILLGHIICQLVEEKMFG